jgi:hypothetical protein
MVDEVAEREESIRADERQDLIGGDKKGGRVNDAE